MMFYDLDPEWDYEENDFVDDEALPALECRKCQSGNVEWLGGDNVVNVGSGMSRVDWYRCGDCGHDFSETYP